MCGEASQGATDAMQEAVGLSWLFCFESQQQETVSLSSASQPSPSPGWLLLGTVPRVESPTECSVAPENEPAALGIAENGFNSCCTPFPSQLYLATVFFGQRIQLPWQPILQQEKYKGHQSWWLYLFPPSSPPQYDWLPPWLHWKKL